MKPTFYCLLLTTGLVLGCREDEGEVTPPSSEASVTFTTIDANVTDVPPDYSLAGSRRDGELLIEEGCFMDLTTHRFQAQSDVFSIYYSGPPVLRKNVNGHSMCQLDALDRCKDDPDSVFGATRWRWVGGLDLAQRDTLRWQYVVASRPEQGYQWIMTERPQKIQAVELPAVFRRGEEHVLTYQKESPLDSLWLQLIFFDKNDLQRADTRPLVIYQGITFNPVSLRVEGDQVTILERQFGGSHDDNFIKAGRDTAFWNVASRRKVVKNVHGSTIEVTYQVNNLYPVRLAD